jgi:hypothetical protein
MATVRERVMAKLNAVEANEKWEQMRQNPPHTLELLHSAMEQLDKIRRYGGEFETRDIYRERISTDLDPHGYFENWTRGQFPPTRIVQWAERDKDTGELLPKSDHIEQVELVIQTVQQIMDAASRTEPPYPFHHGKFCGVWMKCQRTPKPVADAAEVEKNTRNCCGNRDFSPLQTIWENSDACKELVSYLQEHGKRIRNVSRLVVFGLGPLSDDTSVYQHMAVATIRDTLREVQDAPPFPPTPIYAYDEKYCGSCKATLKNKFGVEVTNEFAAYTGVDKYTFVISPNPTSSAPQVALHVPYKDDDGPAAMLCGEVKSDGRYEVQPGIDASSPLLWEWVRKCAQNGDAHDMSEWRLPGNPSPLLAIFPTLLGLKLYYPGWGGNRGGFYKYH